MYPAIYFGTLYGEEDLPDEVYVYYELVGLGVMFEGILTRDGNEFKNGELRLFVESNLIWRLSGEVNGTFISFGRPCLFSESYPFQTPEDGEQANTSIQDTFSDTYTATFQNVELSFTLTRVSLCRWESEELIGESFPLEFYASDQDVGWSVGGIPKTAGLGADQFINDPRGMYYVGGQGDEITIS